jgi:hypothetical protein
MPFRSWLLVAALFVPSAAWADDPKDPLRFVPAQADVVVKIERPRAVFEAVEKHAIFAEAKALAAVRELFDSTNVRRLEQLVAHFEKKLGANKNELLDHLGGGGIVIAGKFDNPAGALLVLQAKDEKRLKQFVGQALQLAEAERDRLEVKIPIHKEDYKGIETITFGDASAAIADGALLIASKKDILKFVLNRHLTAKDGGGILDVASFQEARASLPKGAQAWAWLNLDTVKSRPDFKTGFDAASQDPFQMILFGGLLDTIKRSPYATAVLEQDKNEWRLGVRMPRGREGMSAISKLVTPNNEIGTLPLLATPKTVVSYSYFLDLGQMWEHRRKIFNDKQADAMDKAEQEFAKVAFGAKLGSLLQQMGNHHRVVIAAGEKSTSGANKAYADIPSFALVMDVRDPQFSKSLNLAVRSLGLVGVLASKGAVKMSDKEHGDQKVLCFSFIEGKTFEGDPTGLRFSYSPSFAMVGDQLVFSSTFGLAKDLIDELARPANAKPQAATSRARLYSESAALALRQSPDKMMTQLILAQSLSPAAAREEVRRILALTEKLGTVDLDLNYGRDDFRFDVRWRPMEKR